VESPPEERPPLVVAIEWASRVISISLEMALPALAGYWLDQRLGTKGLLMVLGVILGFCAGMWHLISLTKHPPEDGGAPQRPPGDCDSHSG
jgi:F0F1-type ATP synthase assembly protein I